MLVGGEETEVPYFKAMLPYIQYASTTGSPVVNVPLGVVPPSSDETPARPVGAQLVGRRGEDDDLLRVASVIEKGLKQGGEDQD